MPDRKITDEWGWHWCNDHMPHATDPYRHSHSWRLDNYLEGPAPGQWYAAFACDCTPRHTEVKLVEARLNESVGP